MTTDPNIGKDAAEFFKNMSLENISTNYTTLSVAPLQIKPMILEKIDEQIRRAKAGLPNGLVFKTNSITDKDAIDKIVEASQAGVHTTLFVRGISCIVPGIKGYTENVEVVSIVGRLLEHSRIYGFGVAEDMEIYLSSADLMTRNMDKRVEIAWPILNPALKELVLDYLDVSLSDTAKLRMLESNLEYTPLEYFAEETSDGRIESFDSQAFLIHKAEVDFEDSVVNREEGAIARAARSHINHIIEEPRATSREDVDGNLQSSIDLEVPYPLEVNLTEGEPGVVTSKNAQAIDIETISHDEEPQETAAPVAEQQAVHESDRAAIAEKATRITSRLQHEGAAASTVPTAASAAMAAASAAAARTQAPVAPEEVSLNLGRTPASVASSPETVLASEQPASASTTAQGTESLEQAVQSTPESTVTGASAVAAPAEAPETVSQQERAPQQPETSSASDVSAPEAKESDKKATVIPPAEVEILPRDSEPATVEIQLVEQFPKKPNFWKRLKFLFTGHF